MSAQTSYSIKQNKAYAGEIYALFNHDVASRLVETAAGLEFGVAVSRGTDKDKQVALGGTDFLGITVRSLEREGAANTGDIKYSQKESAGVMRKGAVWVVCPAGCNPGDQVKYDNTTGVLDAGSAGAGETQLDNAYFDSTAAAGELAVLVIETTSTTAGS